MAPSKLRSMQTSPLMQVKDLNVWFSGRGLQVIKAVDGITFEIQRGETLGLVGESGCGKSTTGRALLQLVRPTRGHIYYQGQDLTQLPHRQLRPLRQQLQMIFQDPFASLNPRMTVADLIGEALQIHRLTKNSSDQQAQVRQLMEQVGLEASFVNRYPHEFSGGQRQRIMIARALASKPCFVVCDEPIAALDVSIQAQIINLMQDLQDQLGLTYLFIAHDLNVVRHVSDRIAVMYLGKIVELTDQNRLTQTPLHPYTQALLSAIPIPNPDLEAQRQPILLSGELPSSTTIPTGCRFHPRCPSAEAQCREAPEPLLKESSRGHYVACHLHKPLDH